MNGVPSPPERPDRPRAAGHPRPGTDAGDDRVRVLVVDDTEHVRDMLIAILDVDGFLVVGQAADGATAVELATALDPDVVVVDYMMPAVDGLETSRRIRRVRPHQTVILYSAFVDPAVAAEAEAAGVALCLGKVDGLGLLESEIARLGRGARADRPATRAPGSRP